MDQYTITFYACNVGSEVSVIVHSVDAVRTIVHSGANVMVEWDQDEWGDAAGGCFVTETLAELIGE